MKGQHDGCSYRWRPVTCDRCQRAYTPRPGDDMHCAPEGDHVCTRCLAGESHLSPRCPVCDAKPSVVIDVTAHCPTDDCPVWAWDVRESPLIVQSLAMILSGQIA